MKYNPILEEHYGKMVWTNKRTDSLRREECLCLHCSKMNHKWYKNCWIAQVMYWICKFSHIAFIMTRCKKYKFK